MGIGFRVQNGERENETQTRFRYRKVQSCDWRLLENDLVLQVVTPFFEVP